MTEMIVKNLDMFFLASLNAYQKIHRESFFGRPLEPKEIDLIKNTLVFRGFLKLRSLISGNEDCYLILRLIEKNVDSVFELIKMESEEKDSELKKEFEKLKGEFTEKKREVFNKKFSEGMEKI